MMKFRTAYDEQPKIVSNSGERFHVTHKLFVDQDGTYDLKINGKVDTYDEIQSWRDSVDIKVLLDRYTKGDVSALNKNHLMYGDFTQTPKTLAEYQQLQMNVEQLFESLPVEKRAMFGNSSSRFVASYGTDAFFDALGVKVPAPAETTVVKEEILSE